MSARTAEAARIRRRMNEVLVAEPLARKNDVEYQSARTPAWAAADGTARTERFVGWVRELLH